MHFHDERLSGGHIFVHQHDAVEIVFAGGGDTGTLVYLDGIEEVEHGKVLHGQHFVHALKTQPALAVEKIGDMCLLEPCLLGQTQTGEVSFPDPVPQGFAQVFLQSSEFHARSIAPAYSHLILTIQMQHLKGNRVLDFAVEQKLYMGSIL